MPEPSLSQPQFTGKRPLAGMEPEAYALLCEERESIMSGVQFPGPDGFSHYRYAYGKVIDALRAEGGVGLALTWLDRAMPTYRLLLTQDESDTFEATIKAVCEAAS